MVEEIIRISGKQPVIELYNELSLRPPEDLDSMSDRQMLVLKSLADGTVSGMIAGYISEGTDFCRIHIPYLEPGHRNMTSIRQLGHRGGGMYRSVLLCDRAF